MAAIVKPVICFYESESYLYSTNYVVTACPNEMSTFEFLNGFELKHSQQMKIVQINFDAFSEIKSLRKNHLYTDSKATVYILKHFEILSLRDIQLKHTSLLRGTANLIEKTEFHLQIKKADFIEKVHSIRRMIAAGRFYQVNLTSSFKAIFSMDSLQFFFMMTNQFTGQYKCHLPMANHAVISFSPELFLEKKANLLRTAPIKGSGAIADEENLLASKKEQAELSMIVDLLRNDLNGLETNNSAVVTTHRQLMNLNYIQHTYSEVQIKTEKTLPDILKNVMPAGSISGCPKKESLLAIDELEPDQRHAYTGTIGWWKGCEFKLNVAIRSFVQTEESYLYFAGCGIVYDSNPEAEFTELLKKAGNLNVHFE